MDDYISIRQEIFEYVSGQYGTKPEYLWKSSPNCSVLRHSGNNKWYGIIMDVTKNKLGLSGTDIVDILNVKCDPDMIGSLRMQAGVLPAYHMNKENWISILLDGTVEKERIFPLIDMSFALTGTPTAPAEPKAESPTAPPSMPR